MLHAIEILEERQCALRALIRQMAENQHLHCVTIDSRQEQKECAEINDALISLRAIMAQRKETP